MMVITLILHVLVSLGLVFFILLHSGRGSGLSDMFGGALGATAAATSVGERNLDRITVLLSLTFMFTTIALALMLA
jgi:preprotein translocase subunit SecG